GGGPGQVRHGARGGDGPVDLEVLLAVEDHDRVHRQARDLAGGGGDEPLEGRHDAEAREHGQPLLVGVGQLGGVGRLVQPGADAEVVEDDVVGVPAGG